MRLGLAIPVVDSVPCEVLCGLLKLSGQLGGEAKFLVSKNVIPHYRARNVLLERAVKEDIDRLLWVDSDMNVPQELFHALMWEMDHSGSVLVTGSYLMRGFPYTPLWYKSREGKLIAAPMEERAEIDACGFGCCLMDVGWVKEKGIKFPEEKAEDLGFCKEVRKAGGKIVGVPVECGHLHCRLEINSANVVGLRKLEMS